MTSAQTATPDEAMAEILNLIRKLGARTVEFGYHVDGLRLDAARVGAEIRRLRGIIQRVAEAPNPWAVQAILYAEGFADSPELSE